MSSVSQKTKTVKCSVCISAPKQTGFKRQKTVVITVRSSQQGSGSVCVPRVWKQLRMCPSEQHGTLQCSVSAAGPADQALLCVCVGGGGTTGPRTPLQLLYGGVCSYDVIRSAAPSLQMQSSHPALFSSCEKSTSTSSTPN